MPINYRDYPADWERIRDRVKRRSGNRCELCGANNGQPNPISGSKVVLTVAHLDHDIGNNNPENLKHLCQRCHLNHDKEQHRKSYYRNREMRRQERR
jgi:hypothetical protein